MNEPKANRIGVIIGRFQIDILHEAHCELIDLAIEENDDILILIGSSVVKDSDRNPLSFDMRRAMINDDIGGMDLHNKRVSVQELKDMHSDTVWSAQVDRLILETFGVGDVTLYAGRDSFAPHYHGQFPIKGIELYGITVSATERRKEIAEKFENSTHFRRGVIHAKANQYPKAYPTVDIAVLRMVPTEYAFFHDLELLLGRKPNEDKFRLPGGFVDPTDGSYEDAARREAREETDAEIGSLSYLGSFKIDDWRYRQERHKIITTLFSGFCNNPIAVKAGDDLAEVKWAKLVDLAGIGEIKHEIVAGHIPLINKVLQSRGYNL